MIKVILPILALAFFIGCGETDAEFLTDDKSEINSTNTVSNNDSIYDENCVQVSDSTLCGFNSNEEDSAPPTFPCQDKENCK